MFAPANTLFRIGLWLVVPAATLRADAPSELKATLAKLEGTAAVSAKVAVQWSTRSGDAKSPNLGEATADARFEAGPQGLKVTWSSELLRRVADEAAAVKSEANRPLREAVEALSAPNVGDYLNAAPELLRRLRDATFVSETPQAWQGRPARLLTFKLNLPLGEKERKYIKQLDADARVWVGGDGLPLAAESRVALKGRAFLVIGFEQSEREEFEFGHVGDRLMVRKHVKESSGSGGGESGQRKLVATVTVE